MASKITTGLYNGYVTALSLPITVLVARGRKNSGDHAEEQVRAPASSVHEFSDRIDDRIDFAGLNSRKAMGKWESGKVSQVRGRQNQQQVRVHF